MDGCELITSPFECQDEFIYLNGNNDEVQCYLNADQALFMNEQLNRTVKISILNIHMYVQRYAENN